MQLTSRIFIKDLLTWNLTVYKGQKELERLLEVADIIDELKMIQHLLETQIDVLKSAISALINLNPFLEGENFLRNFISLKTTLIIQEEPFIDFPLFFYLV